MDCVYEPGCMVVFGRRDIVQAREMRRGTALVPTEHSPNVYEDNDGEGVDI
jgi:hypothetical protein